MTLIYRFMSLSIANLSQSASSLYCVFAAHGLPSTSLKYTVSVSPRKWLRLRCQVELLVVDWMTDWGSTCYIQLAMSQLWGNLWGDHRCINAQGILLEKYVTTHWLLKRQKDLKHLHQVRIYISFVSKLTELCQNMDSCMLFWRQEKRNWGKTQNGEGNNRTSFLLNKKWLK